MRLLSPPIVTAVALAVGACRPAQGPDPNLADGAETRGPVNAIAVSDEEFASRAAEILADPVSEQVDRDLLAGVVRRQLTRAERRFAAGADEAGLSALEGAMLLMRPSTFHPAIFEGTVDALRSGAATVARLGNEGRALALYSILHDVLPPGDERKDVERHLKELERWTHAMRQAGPMQDRGVHEQTAVDRALFEVSRQRVQEAHDATVAWVGDALEFDASTLDIGASPEQRDEAVQAYRAIKAGGMSLIALYLRSGDADGALAAVQDRAIERVVAPALTSRLKDAARGDPRAWAELNQFYGELSQEDQREISIDGSLARAAAWGTAVELFRLAPHETEGVMPLAQELQAREMGEVAPIVLAGAFDENADPYPLSWAMALVLRVMLDEAELGQHDASRRTFEAAGPLLKLAKLPRLRTQVRPSAARLCYVMGALEAQAGDADQASKRLAAALALDGSNLETLMLLARVERQRRNPDRALQLFSKAASIAARTQEDAEAATASLEMFEVHRDRGSSATGETALRTALERALEARKTARNASELARAERVLARVLEHYGDTEGARRATQRALDSARSDVDDLAATLLDAARRALTLADLRLARVAAREAIEEELPAEDLVYVALWLQLLERRLGEPADGSALEAFTTMGGSGWIATLGAWGRSEIDDEALTAAAQTLPQQTEAAFYTAMRHHDSTRSTAGLRRVAESEAIDLVEVTIARDLLANAQATGFPQLPESVELP